MWGARRELVWLRFSSRSSYAGARHDVRGSTACCKFHAESASPSERSDASEAGAAIREDCFELHPVMKIVIPGGSGQVGTILARSFHARGEEVVVLSRTPSEAPWRVIPWDATSRGGAWESELNGADVVINLIGRSVNCRYTTANRTAIKQSRVISTEVLAAAMADCPTPPRIWLNSSTATIYAHRYDAPNDEATGIIGGNEPDSPDTWRFSIDVATSWERAAASVPLPQTRVVMLRSAMVMSPDVDGVFDTLLGLVKYGLGGTSGNGRQYVSWIHDADFLRAIDWIIAHDHLRGPINLAAPNPLPNAEFMRDIRRAWGMPIGLPALAWMLEIGAVFLQTETELILKSRRVVPGTLLRDGFKFAQPYWADAVRDLCVRSRAMS
jgi:uncharacterized protein